MKASETIRSEGWPGPATGGAAGVEAAAGAYAIQPSADRRSPLEATQALPGRQQRLLEGVLGVLYGAEHPVAVHFQLPLVTVDELAECRLVPVTGTVEKVRGHHLLLRSPGSSAPAAAGSVTGTDTGRSENWAPGPAKIPAGRVSA